MPHSSLPYGVDRAQFALPDRATQSAIGLALAVVIAGSWLAIHFYGLFVFELSWASLPTALVLAAVQCWLSVGVFIVCHDAMHGSLVPGHTRINAWVGAVLLFLYAGFRWSFVNKAHHSHHALSGHAGDPDFDEHHPTRFWPWYATFFKRYFGWQSLLFVHAVVGLYWIGFGVPMEQIVLLYGAPALASSLQLFYFGTYRPHCHREGEGGGFADQHNARTDSFGTLTSLMTCFHFGYHLEHHHRPDVPWWALPAARRAGVVAQAPESAA